MESILKVWDVVKGKVAATVLTVIFGLSLVVTYTGLEVVDCPETLTEGSVCLSPVVVEATTIEDG
jgi:hypothetical protein